MNLSLAPRRQASWGGELRPHFSGLVPQAWAPPWLQRPQTTSPHPENDLFLLSHMKVTSVWWLMGQACQGLPAFDACNSHAMCAGRGL